MQTPDSGWINATRTLTGVDLEVINPEGETIATVVMTEARAWELFKSFGEELNA